MQYEIHHTGISVTRMNKIHVFPHHETAVSHFLSLRGTSMFLNSEVKDKCWEEH